MQQGMFPYTDLYGGNRHSNSHEDDAWFFSGFPVAICQCDTEGQITYYNKAALELWGRQPATGPGVWCGCWKAYSPEKGYLSRDEYPLALVLKGRERTLDKTEMIFERQDGGIRRVMVQVRTLFDKLGSICGAYCTMADITPESGSVNRQAILSAIVEYSDDAIISKDLSGNITSWNKSAQRIFGYREEEVLGKPVTLLIPLERASEEDHILGQIRQGKTIDHFQTVRLDKWGRPVPVSLTISPIRDLTGRLIGASKIARDISSEVGRQALIRQHAKNLLIINELNKTITGSLDRSGIMQEVVSAAIRLTGAENAIFFYFPDSSYTPHIAKGGKNMQLPDLEDVRRPLWQSFFLQASPLRTRGGVVKSPLKDYISLFQESYTGSFLAIPLLEASKNVSGKLVLIHSQQGMFTPLHEELIKSIASYAAISLDNARLFDELNIMGKRKDDFIAMAGHELKTPLTSISSYLQILEAECAGGTNAKFVTKSRAQVKKMQELIAELLDISKIESGQMEFSMEKVDLVVLLSDVTDLFRISSPSHVIEYAFPGHDCVVTCDRKRIEQVLQNLVGNAIKYSPASSSICVSLAAMSDGYRIDIRDFGIGLSVRDQERIFDRYYRAENGRNAPGLGLGLFISRDIVTRHKGTLSVESEEGAGSCFTVTLPRSPLADAN